MSLDRREQDAPWLQLGAEVCRHAGISFSSLEVLSTWDRGHSSNAVFEVDGRIFLKVFGPDVPEQFHRERTILEVLAGRHAIPAPEVLAQGELASALSYLLLARVPGFTAEQVWEQVPRDEQLAIARELGEIVAAINALSQDGLRGVESRFGGRRAFARHWCRQLIDQIEKTAGVLPEHRHICIDFLNREAQAQVEAAPLVTHRELAHNHIYLDRRLGRWRVAGIIDWADAMLGPQEWDIAFIWFWTLNRDVEAMRLFLASRYDGRDLPHRLARRCLGAILQTYEGPGLWGEFVERHERSTADPVQEMADLLFPPDVFGRE